MNNILALQALQAEQAVAAEAGLISNSSASFGCTSGTYVPDEFAGE